MFGVLSALGILVALAANVAPGRSQAAADALSGARLGAVELGSANVALAVRVFRNWVHQLALKQGVSIAIRADVIRDFVAVPIPLVLATTGWHLWHRGWDS